MSDTLPGPGDVVLEENFLYSGAALTGGKLQLPEEMQCLNTC